MSQFTSPPGLSLPTNIANCLHLPTSLPIYPMPLQPPDVFQNYFCNPPYLLLLLHHSRFMLVTSCRRHHSLLHPKSTSILLYLSSCRSCRLRESSGLRYRLRAGTVLRDNPTIPDIARPSLPCSHGGLTAYSLHARLLHEDSLFVRAFLEILPQSSTFAIPLLLLPYSSRHKTFESRFLSTTATCRVHPHLPVVDSR